MRGGRAHLASLWGLFCPEDAWQGMSKGDSKQIPVVPPQRRSNRLNLEASALRLHTAKGHEGRSAVGGKVLRKKRSFIQSITLDSR